jgi:hypothetical protein
VGAAPLAFPCNLPRAGALDPYMGDEPDHMVCKACGRRYAAPAILETRECPRCGGELIPLEEGRETDQAGGDYQGR